MDTIKHPKHDRYWGAPRGWDPARDGPCGALSVHDRTHENMAVMESMWKPTAQEAVALALGVHNIKLGIFGQVHPVVYMGTAIVPEPVPTPEMIHRIETAAQWLADIARGYGLRLNVTTLGLATDAKEVAAVTDTLPPTTKDRIRK